MSSGDSTLHGAGEPRQLFGVVARTDRDDEFPPPLRPEGARLRPPGEHGEPRHPRSGKTRRAGRTPRWFDVVSRRSHGHSPGKAMSGSRMGKPMPQASLRTTCHGITGNAPDQYPDRGDHAAFSFLFRSLSLESSSSGPGDAGMISDGEHFPKNVRPTLIKAE